MLLAALLAAPAFAGWVTLRDDGLTAGATAIRSGCVAPGQYERPLTPLASVVTIEGLPDTGRCYFALNAGPQDEWTFDFTAIVGGRAAPGAVRNLDVTWAPAPPPPAVSVTVSGYTTATGEFDLVITGSGPVTFTVSGTSMLLDWCKPGGENGTVVTPTVPDLGVANNDPIKLKAVTFTAPVTQTRCDLDPNAAFPGATITVSGLSKPLVQSGSSWSTRF